MADDTLVFTNSPARLTAGCRRIEGPLSAMVDLLCQYSRTSNYVVIEAVDDGVVLRFEQRSAPAAPPTAQEK